MFTGLVERVGELSERTARGKGARLVITCGEWEDPLVDGESVAVQGACLTVTGSEPGRFWCDVLAETLDKTQLGLLAIGGKVNLERAMKADGRFGGHIVTGHVDETGRVAEVRTRGDDWVLRVSCSQTLAHATVEKGSITIDGVSLTVTAVDDGWLEVNIIPYTWSHTSLVDRRVGDQVNLEGDILGKYVARILGGGRDASGVTLEKLSRAGFM